MKALLVTVMLALATSEHLQCRQCTPGEYCFLDDKYICPQHSTSVAGAHNITQCVCSDGFYADESHNCIPCITDHYCQQDLKLPCGADRTSTAYASSSADCVCVAGHEGASCTACTPGYFKNISGNQACTICAANTFTDQQGSTACTECIANAHAEPGSSTCTCNDGYELVQGACLAICEQHSTRNMESLTCVCDPGHYLHNSTCAYACEPGTYKSDHGNQQCTECAANTYQPATAATICSSCTPHSTSAAGSTSSSQCLCDPGYTLQDGLCIQCTAGMFKGWSGNEPCQSCAAGTYRSSSQDPTLCSNCSSGFYQPQTGQSECLSCQSNSVSAEGQALCLCNAGFLWAQIDVNTFHCMLCAKGSYKESVGNTDCTPCLSVFVTSSMGSISATNCTACYGFITEEIDGRTCNECPPNSVYSMGGTTLQSCKCLPGYSFSYDAETDTMTCDACVNGKYKDTTSNNICTHCPTGNIGIAETAIRDELSSSCVPCATDEYRSSLTECTACPQNSTSPAGSDDPSACLCAPGFTLDGTNCVPCASGHVKAVVGNHQCTACSAGKYTVAETCVDCPAFSTSAEASSSIGSCQCTPGYTGADGTACTACAAGSYKVSVGPASCVECTPGTYQDDTPPYITYACEQCPENTTSPSASFSISACQCRAGYLTSEDPSVLSCHPCAAGSYCIDDVTQLPCSTGATSPLASDHAHDCTCMPGFVGANNSCSRCPVNFYCEGGQHVQQCHDNSSTLTLAGTTNVSACVCNPGFYDEQCTHVFEAKTWYLPPTMSYFNSNGDEAGRIDLEPTPSWSWGDFTFIIKIELTATSDDAIYYNYWDPVSRLAIQFSRTGAHTNRFWLFKQNSCTLTWDTASNRFNIMQVVVTWDNDAKELSVRGQDMVKDGSPGSTIDSETVIDDQISCVNVDTSVIEINSVEAQNNAAYFNRINAHPSKKLSAKVYGVILVDSIVSQLETDALISAMDTSTHFEPGLTNSVYIPSSQHSSQSALQTFTCTNTNLQCWCSVPTPFCAVCPVDSWCYHNAENNCPNNSSSLAQTSTVAKCFCDEYFTKDAAGQCHLCGSHLVCHASDMVTEGVVEQCVQHSSNQHQSCVCEDGYYCRDGSTNTSCSDLYQGSCSYCEIGSFCQGNLKTACSVNETSAVGSSTIASCKCKPGYYRSGSLCLLCEIDSFCPGLQDETKYECSSYDPELITLQAGSHAREQCLCKDGFFRTSNTDLCKWCPFDYYCVSESISGLPNVDSCIPNAYTLTRGVSDRQGCICDAGFVLSNDAGTAECLPCESGQRCGGGEVLDAYCGANNRVANEDHSACICLPGYQENVHGLCELCPSPTFKDVAGDFACSLCPDTAHYYNETFCVNCLENEERSADGLSCSCVAPLARSDYGYNCEPCPADTYYDAGTCVACTAHSTTRGVTGATSPDACVCDAGYIVEGDLCTACSSGTYEKNGQCVSCGVNTVSPEASHSSTQCGCAAGSCQSFLWNHTCFGECEPTLEPCSACKPGFFKNFVSQPGNLDTCSRCPLDSFANTSGQVACHECPPKSVTTDLGSDSVTDCVCDKGNEKIASSCEHCQAGFAKNTIGNHACTACSKGFYSDVEESLLCQECTRFNNDTTVAEAADSESLCVCVQGFFLEDNACVPCIDGAYKSDDGNHNCTLCGHDPIHSYAQNNDVGAVSQDVCAACPANSGQQEAAITFQSPMNDETDCLCFPGHEDVNNVCQQCDSYKLKLGFSDEACRYCDAGYYFVSHTQACVQCTLQDAINASRVHVGHAINSLTNQSESWGTDFADCTCDLGHERVGDECSACTQGKFRQDHAQEFCQFCGFDFYADTTASVQCTQCPLNSFTNITGATSIDACYCEDGHEMDESTHTCTLCAAGKFKPRGPGVCTDCDAGTYSLQGAASCTACKESETSAVGSPSEAHCVCVAGRGGTDCQLCSEGFYAEQGSIDHPDKDCDPCPAGKGSPIGAPSIDSCVCLPGFGVDPTLDAHNDCTECPDGQYALGGQNTYCRLCGFATVTEPATSATSIEACQCDASQGVF